MKSFKGPLILFFIFFFYNLNAQFFAGGNIHFSSSTDKSEFGNNTTYDASNLSFSVSPFIGKFLSDKLACGLEIDLTASRNREGVNTKTISKSSSIGASPFLRYYFWSWYKFSIYGQGNLGLEFSNSSVESGGSINEGPKGTRAYLNLYPGLAFDVSDKISLQTSLNFMNFGYSYVTLKEGSDREHSSNFNIGAGLGNIISIGSITLGGIYKF